MAAKIEPPSWHCGAAAKDGPAAGDAFAVDTGFGTAEAGGGESHCCVFGGRGFFAS